MAQHRRATRRLLATTLMGVLAAGGATAPASAMEVRGRVGARTELAGRQLPSSTLSAQWSPTSRRGSTLTAQGWNPPAALSTIVGTLTMAGPVPAGPLCVTRRYTVEAAGQQTVGSFRQVIVVVDGDKRRSLGGMEDPYTASPIDLKYEVTHRLELTAPRLRAGARLVWRFTATMNVPVTSYQERVRVRRARC